MSYRSQAWIKSTQYIEGSAVETTAENLLIIHNSDGTSSKVTDYVEIDKIAKTIKAEFDALAYSRKRQAEYPSIHECVHAILDDDLTALQEKRQAVKTKYPKS